MLCSAVTAPWCATSWATPRLAHLAALPRRELYDLPDPRLAVLRDALRRGRAVWIDLDEPEPASAGQ